jgi:PP-loop superfamily ATP-utilizing enzyme
MRKQDVILVLLYLFVLRLIAFSGTYVDSICVVAILAYQLGNKVLEIRTITNEALVKISKNEELNTQRFQEVATELTRVRNSNDGIKAAFNLTKK